MKHVSRRTIARNTRTQRNNVEDLLIKNILTYLTNPGRNQADSFCFHFVSSQSKLKITTFPPGEAGYENVVYNCNCNCNLAFIRRL